MAYRLRYKNRSSFYHMKKRPVDGFGAPTKLGQPHIGREANAAFIADQNIDLRSRENIEMAEAMRHPREKDFYQDHTYHDQWEQRDLDKAQSSQLRSRYYYFADGFQVTPWVWFPGDIVEVVDGPQAGQRGSIISVIPYKNEIIVQNINVKDVSIPAGDGRPEQVVQREHPIRCTLTKHVDPSTGEICTVKIIQVRAKQTDEEAAQGIEPGTEDRRISLESGTILPIPPRDANKGVETGDPLRDTPYQDAMDLTYEADKEMAVLVERKLAALEEHFVKSLKQSYTFHSNMAEKNVASMKKFQRDAFDSALDKVAAKLNKDAENLPDWWFEELAPHVDALEQKKAAKAAMRASKDASALEAARLAEEAALAAEADEEFEEMEEAEEDRVPEDLTNKKSEEKRE